VKPSDTGGFFTLNDEEKPISSKMAASNIVTAFGYPETTNVTCQKSIL